MRWLAATVFVATFLVRLLSVTGFPNDHYLYLAPAQQMLAGEWPSRDFVDPGTPLMYVVSAAARLIVDAPLLAEALVVAAAYALAAALTLSAAFQVSGSLIIATAIAFGQVAMFPRSYHYPKLLVYAVGILAIWHYLRSPTLRRAALVAGCVVAGFLFRHDHGVYLGGAAVLAALLTDGDRGLKARRAAVMGGLIVLGTLPYATYVASTSGLTYHLASGLEYSTSEAERTFVGLPRIDPATRFAPANVYAALFYLFHVLAVIALALAASRRHAAMTVVAALGIALNVSMLRDPLDARLPDVAVTTCILGAWLIAEAWRLRGWKRLAGTAVVVALSALAALGVETVGRPREHLDRAGLLLPMVRWPAVARERLAELRAPFAPRQFPSDVIESLVPLFEYVGRCTTPAHRLVVAGNAPEIYVYARRLFAGGQPMFRRGFFTTPRDEERVVRALRQNDVPLAIVLPDADFDVIPHVTEELQRGFVPIAELSIEGHGTGTLRMNRRVTPAGVDAMTGWPCFL